MPAYEYRCNACGRPVTLTYKSYAAYDEARAAGLTCPQCGAADLTRLISRVAVAKAVASAAGNRRVMVLP